MKSMAKKVVAVLMASVICLSMCLSVSAATISKAQHKSPQYGGGAATVFYVNAKNKNTTSINYSSDAWNLYDKYRTARSSLQWRYAYTEVQIWGRNNTSEGWKYISKTNVKNKRTQTLSMKGYTQYKVRVYSWKTSTIGTYIGGDYNSSAYWSDGMTPTCTFTAKSNVKSLAK